jgi:hypothetical protein
MTIEQTIEIPPNHRLVFDLPPDMPTGRANVELTVIPKNRKTELSAENPPLAALDGLLVLPKLPVRKAHGDFEK